MPSSVVSLRTTLRVVAPLLAATALSPGCAPVPDEATGSVVQALNANSRTAFDYFLARGLSAVQAAGIVGNLMQESNCDPTAVQAGGPGRGIAQWSVGGRWDHDSGDNEVAYATSQHASEWALSLQLDFIWYELTTFSGYGLGRLRGNTDVTSATVTFETDFEGCGTCDQSQRISYANQALAAYGADAAAWGATFVSQSFPYASVGAVTIEGGHTATISLTMRNSGSHAWDTHTCIGTTEPRDRSSPFAGPEWSGPNRPACLPAGTSVANGASHTFTWVMHAPATAGRYDEHWGMVEDGAAWFGDPGEGGPPDSDLEGIFTVTAAPPPPVDAGVQDAGAPDAGHDSGPDDVDGAEDVMSASDGGPVDDVTPLGDDAGVDDVAPTDDGGLTDGAMTAPDAGPTDAASDAVDERGVAGPLTGGCSCRVTHARGAGGAGARALLIGLIALASTRHRRRRRTV